MLNFISSYFMLTNFDIERLSIKLDLPLVGVFCKDELASQLPRLGSYYINMDNSNLEGSHWVLMKIFSDDERSDSDDSDFEQDEVRVNALYFDSFGFGCPLEVQKFLKNIKPIYYNNRQIQDIGTTECGWYCLACDYVLEHKKHTDSYLTDYEMFLEMWSSNPKKNLAILKQLFKPL